MVQTCVKQLLEHSKIIELIADERKKLKIAIDSGLNRFASVKLYGEALEMLKNTLYPGFCGGDVAVIKYVLCYNYLYEKIREELAEKWTQEIKSVNTFPQPKTVYSKKERKNFFGKNVSTCIMKNVFLFECITGQSVLSTTKLKLPELPAQKLTKVRIHTSTKQTQTMTSVKAQQTQTVGLKRSVGVQTQIKEAKPIAATQNGDSRVFQPLASKDFLKIHSELEEQRSVLGEIKKLQVKCVEKVSGKISSTEKGYVEKVKQLETEIYQKDDTIREKDERLLLQQKELMTVLKQVLVKTQSTANDDLRQRFFISQSILNNLWEKYCDLQKLIINDNVLKCESVIKNLKDMSTTIVSGELIHRELESWQSELQNAKLSHNYLNFAHQTYLKILEDAKSFSDVTDYMKPVGTPITRQNVSFVTNFPRNEPQKPNHRRKLYVQAPVAPPPPTPPPPTPPPPTPPPPPPPFPRRNLPIEPAASTENIAAIVVKQPPPPVPVVQWQEIKDRGVGPNFWRLIDNLKPTFPDVIENRLVDAVEKVRLMHGKLSGMSMDEIYEEVLKFLQPEEPQHKQKPAWKTAWQEKWDGTNQDNDCPICFEPFEDGTSKSLACLHIFHKDCIDLWLQENRLCPICRKFSVSDEVFPPLKH